MSLVSGRPQRSTRLQRAAQNEAREQQILQAALLRPRKWHKVLKTVGHFQVPCWEPGKSPISIYVALFFFSFLIVIV